MPGLARTRVLERLFFEQYSHELAIAVAHNLISCLHQQDEAKLTGLRAAGYRALDVMEGRLTTSPWLIDLIPGRRSPTWGCSPTRTSPTKTSSM